MSDATGSRIPAPGTTGDTKAIIRSILGTGIGLATLLLMLAGLTIQQNVNVNARIDDVNARINDVNANVNARIDDVNTNVNARIDDVNARIDDLQEDIRELRALIIDAIKGPDPAD
jgi:septal ring factor EnvC (AmiA/AmiB activator)